MTFPEKSAAAGAILGGLLWLIKAGATLWFGVQPPLIFESAPLLFALALIGMWVRLKGRGGWYGRLGLWLAWVSGLAALVQVTAFRLAPQLVPDQASVTLLTPVVVLAGIGSLLALLLLGIATWREQTLSRPWHLWPLAMTVAYPVLMALAVMAEGALELSASQAERLVEIPIALLGLAWMRLGFLLAIPQST